MVFTVVLKVGVSPIGLNCYANRTFNIIAYIAYTAYIANTAYIACTAYTAYTSCIHHIQQI